MESRPSAFTEAQMKEIFHENTTETEEFLQSLYKGKNLAKNYATYRQNYPMKIYDEIMSYHKGVLTNGRQLAVDVACGTGLSTLPLVPLFNKVVGVDVSEDLMEYLPRDIPNLTALVCSADNMTMIESGTVDLVTVATGLHWLNTEKFFQEAKRILKPGGTFAAYSWHTGRLEPEAANQAYKEYFMKFKDFMTTKTALLIEKFNSIKFPFHDLRRFEMDVLDEMPIDQLMGLLSSCHAVTMYDEAHPGNDQFVKLGKSLEAIIAPDGDANQPISIKFYNSVFMVMGRNR